MNTAPSSTTYPYETPSIVEVLTLSSYVYVLNAVGATFETAIHADLVGYLVVGMVYGPPLGNILPTAWLQCFTSVGYIGLILLVFQGGLVTDPSMILPNITLSICVALTGISLPIALSIAYLPFALDYSLLQGFAAGASLSSTSLGTTLAVLSANNRASVARHSEKSASPGSTSTGDDPIDIRKTRLGTVLMTAALADDIVALVLAAIVPKLGEGGFTWRIVVRPVLVSVAFVVCIPLLSKVAINPLLRRASQWDYTRLRSSSTFKSIGAYVSRDAVYLFALVGILSGFVTGASYGGTSELLGAYIAGCWMRATGRALLNESSSGALNVPMHNVSSPASTTRTIPAPGTIAVVDDPIEEPFTAVFEKYIEPVLHRLFAPLFFGSIGSSIPFLNLWRPARVVWQGFVFSVLMAIGKAAAGLWWLVWPRQPANGDPSAGFSRKTGALFIGLALIARGEIALLVASLARSILQEKPGGGTQEELYAIVMWGTLACTVGGAMGVGAVVSCMR